MKPISAKGFQPRVYLAILALASFILSFMVARTFTYFFPNVVLISGDLHFHHFWFGLILLAIGGWLGISYNQKEIDMAAAIIYGVGGGIIADEIGLLLTFGDYYSELTWTFTLLLISFVAALILFSKYRQNIVLELHEFVSNKVSLPFGVFLAAISVAFILETNNILITVVSSVSTIIAILIILAFIVHQFRHRSS